MPRKQGTTRSEHKERIGKWWKKTVGQKEPDAVAQLQEEMKSDRARLFSVCRERPDGAELVDTIVRLVENAYSFGHYAGIRRGYLLGREVGKDGTEDKIIKLIRTKLDTTPTEIAERIDKFNSRFDDLEDFRGIHFASEWPELAAKTSKWVAIVRLPKVKNYLVRAHKRAEAISRIQGWQRIMSEHQKNRRRLLREG